MLCPDMPTWYSQVSFGFYQLGLSGYSCAIGTEATCPILSNF